MAMVILHTARRNPAKTMMNAPLRRVIAASLLLSYGACVQADSFGSLTSGFPYSRLDGKPVTSGGSIPDALTFTWQATESVPEQYDPLSSVMSIEFGEGIVTVGDAVNQVVKPIGFELVSEGQRVSLLLPELLAEPLPDMQRSMDHLRVREILRTLGGPGFMLVVDVVHRAITFDPRPRYMPIGQESTPNTKPVSIVPVLSTGSEARMADPPHEEGWVAVPASDASFRRMGRYMSLR